MLEVRVEIINLSSRIKRHPISNGNNAEAYGSVEAWARDQDTKGKGMTNARGQSGWQVRGRATDETNWFWR